MIIVVDTEATGLVQPISVPLHQQPRLVEFAAKKLEPITLKVVDELTFMVHPDVPLPLKFTEITGITEDDVMGKPRFTTVVNEVTDFFLGVRTFVAHNVSYDSPIIRFALMRLGREFQFPWPPEQFCTVENTTHLGEGHHAGGKFLKLIELYEILHGNKPEQKHRAMSDVDIVIDCLWTMKEKGMLSLSSDGRIAITP